MLLGLGFAKGTGAPPSCEAGGLSGARLLKTGGGLGVPGIADPGTASSDTWCLGLPKRGT